MPVPSDPNTMSLALDMNITDDRADELIKKYVATPFLQWEHGMVPGLRAGNIYKIISDRDELTTNEKCYLCIVLCENINKASLRSMLVQDQQLFEKVLHVKQMNGRFYVQ